MMKMKKLKLPFGWDLYVIIGSKEELNIQTKKFGINFKFNNEDKVHGMAEFIYRESPKSSFFIVWVDDDRSDYLYFLLHEIHHIVYIYCEHLEIVDEEFKAYLFEDICKQLKLFKKEKKKKNGNK